MFIERSFLSSIQSNCVSQQKKNTDWKSKTAAICLLIRFRQDTIIYSCTYIKTNHISCIITIITQTIKVVDHLKLRIAICTCTWCLPHTLMGHEIAKPIKLCTKGATNSQCHADLRAVPILHHQLYLKF